MINFKYLADLCRPEYRYLSTQLSLPWAPGTPVLARLMRHSGAFLPSQVFSQFRGVHGVDALLAFCCCSQGPAVSVPYSSSSTSASIGQKMDLGLTGLKSMCQQGLRFFWKL